MAQIRALALHIPIISSEDVIETTIKSIDKVYDCMNKCGVIPWTKRLVFPPVYEYKYLSNLLNDLFSVLDNDIMVGIGIEENSECIDKIVDLLTNYANLYMSTRCNDDNCIRKNIDNIYLIQQSNIDYNIYTKFAVVFGSWIETPYFPATSNISNALGLSISLRYVDLVEKTIFSDDVSELIEFIKRIDNEALCISKCSNIPFTGIDLSLSPWMDESVARIIEKIIKNRIGFPGTVYAIFSLNRLISSIINKLKLRSIGFNEVMLSVAEDIVLNERVKNCDIRIRDLVNYSTVCVAGLDMVAVPKTIDIHSIAIDMLTISKIKRKSVAMRIIPVEQEPTTSINLNMFGTTYVIMP